jgi:predicted MPP superfamily phosphohydrolase
MLPDPDTTLPPLHHSITEERRGRFLVTHLTLTSPRIPEAFHGYSAVQLGDFHLGAATPLTHLDEAFQVVRSLSPELLLLTGDYVQVNRLGVDDLFRDLLGPRLSRWRASRRRAKELAATVVERLEGLSVRDGIYGVFGNHDYHERITERIRGAAARSQWLMNSSVTIHRGEHTVLLSGIDDLWRGTPDLRQALKPDINSTPHCFHITLSHNPDVVLHEDASLLHHSDLILCGHTHGGQIHLPLLGPIVTRTEQREHVRGLSRLSSKTALYTTNGVGYGANQLRILCPPEIVNITLNRCQL